MSSYPTYIRPNGCHASDLDNGRKLPNGCTTANCKRVGKKQLQKNEFTNTPVANPGYQKRLEVYACYHYHIILAPL